MNKSVSLFLKLRIILFITIFMVISSVSARAALSELAVSQLYVSIFGRASEGEGNQYWRTLELDMATTADVMLETDAAKQYFGTSLHSNQAFIEHIYLNTLNKTPLDDPEGIAHWVGLLDNGMTRGQVVSSLVSVINDYAPDGAYYNPDDVVTVAAYNQFENRVIVSSYMADTVKNAPADWATATSFSIDLIVTDAFETVLDAMDKIDDIAARDLDELKSGTFSRHTVDIPAGSPGTVTDPATGLTFEIPAGQSGELGVARLEKFPEAPYPGNGYTIEAEGLRDLELFVPANDLEPGSFPMVYVHAEMQGAFDDNTGYAKRWIGVAYEEEVDGDFRFHLPTPEASAIFEGIALENPPPNDEDPPKPLHFFVSRISSDMPEAEQRMYIGLQVSAYALDFANVLSASSRATFESRRDRRRIGIGYGANYYTGFNKLRFGSYGRGFRPYMEITSPSNTQALAHETGHYLTHLLVGDTVYDSLEAAGGSIFSGNHGIRDSIGRHNLLEDYAYFIESFLKGTGGNYDLGQPHITFDGLSPLTRDFPGLEGFAAHMLEGLRQNRSAMRTLYGTTLPIAPLNVPQAQIFDILARGARSVDRLRSDCEAALDAEDKSAFQVMLGRMGWSYKVKGRLVDDRGDPIVNAMVCNITKVGEEIFVGGTTNLETDANGEFSLMGGVFGGESLLKVTPDGGSDILVPITVDWKEPTDERIDLGDLVVAEQDQLSSVFEIVHSSGQAFPPEFTLSLQASVGIKMVGADLSNVRVERFDDHDYNIAYTYINVFAPVGSELEFSGTLRVIPSLLGGQYAIQDEMIVTWSVTDQQVIAYPPNVFTSQTGNSAIVDTTVTVRDTGLQAQMSLRNAGTFKRSENNAYLGSFQGRVMIQVVGE